MRRKPRSPKREYTVSFAGSGRRASMTPEAPRSRRKSLPTRPQGSITADTPLGVARPIRRPGPIMKSEAAARVAVVGGGFSGVMTAVQLARLGITSTVYDGGPNPGRGTAYGTTDPRHLLNVPAGKMSAFPHDPDHFRAWAGVDAGTFVPRRDYGRYLEDIRAAYPLVTLETREVTALERDGEGWRLNFADGGAVEAATVVLALGNEAPSRPRGWDALAMETNPWSDAALEAVREAGEEDRALLLIGTGLTMIDVVIDRKSTRLNSSHTDISRMPSSA